MVAKISFDGKLFGRTFVHIAKISHFANRKVWWKKLYKLYLRQFSRKNCFRKSHSNIFAYRKVFVTRPKLPSFSQANFWSISYYKKLPRRVLTKNMRWVYVVSSRRFNTLRTVPSILALFFGTLKDCITLTLNWNYCILRFWMKME